MKTLNEGSRISWERPPAMLARDHWLDLSEGAAFTQVRDSAIAVLNCLESLLGRTSTARLKLSQGDERLEGHLDSLRHLARAFLGGERDKQFTREDARSFCLDCCDESDVSLIRMLVMRDGRVLRLSGNDVVPGHAFVQGANSMADGTEGDRSNDEAQRADGVKWPAGASYRLGNLYSLWHDLGGNVGMFDYAS
ncbi:hypothetical protein VI08_12350 [Luteibacter yeojuensis]|uniref:Uncharacterized protein n=2 Tax=Luteibacter yeojuensis TaxID=345309 RepID=A0A0F3KQX1_9GAMM|nr:hypothetical protein VI08_12350 [Luteibacter yeojuensis]